VITQMHARGTLVAAAIRRAYAARDVADPAPQLIAAWDGSGELSDLDAPARPGGYDTDRLAALLAEPLTAGVSPPTRPVWRCTLELDPAERSLTAQEWADAVREFLDQTGLAPRGDRHAVRWIAVAHGHTRVDVVATLVRQDGRVEPARDDRRRCLNATRALERRLGLTTRPHAPVSTRPAQPHPVSTATGTTPPPSARARLRREVRAAAIVAVDEDDFLSRLRGVGLRVRLRRRSDDVVTGYAVSHPAITADTDPAIWFGGGQLAPELSLPQLRNRWAQPHAAEPQPPTTAAQRQRIWQQATDGVTAATEALASPADLLTATSATAVVDILTMTARTLPGTQATPPADAAELLYRAIGSRQRHRPPAPDARAVHFRSLARLIGLMGQLSDDRDVAAALRLVYLLAGFADNLATLRQAQQRRAQAAAASTAAARLHAAAREGPRPPAVTTPPPAPPVAPVQPAHQRSRRGSR
jgi:hypothetical protein